MKITRILTAFLLVVLLAAGWYGSITRATEKQKLFVETVNSAEEKLAKGLYRDSFAQFSAALAINSDITVRHEYYDACNSYYINSGDSASAGIILDMLEEACAAEPENEEYWIRRCEVLMDEGSFSIARKCVTKAIDAIPDSEALQQISAQVRYIYSEHYSSYSAMRCGGAYFCVNDYSGWQIIDNDGQSVLKNAYSYISPVGNEEIVLVTDEDGVNRFIDFKGIDKGFFPAAFKTTGKFVSGLIPITYVSSDKVDFINIDGETVLGPFDAASSFSDEIAAVCRDGRWMLISPNGSECLDSIFDDIVISDFDEAVCKGMFVASVNGKYSLYKTDGTKLTNIDALAMDAYYGEPVAFLDPSGKWGFVDKEGHVICDPVFDGAASFSDGLAAVLSDGMWGFVDNEFRQVIPNDYISVGHFTKDGRCAAVDASGRCRLLKLYFE